MRAIKKNLRDGERVRVMYCPLCGEQCSADAADYWNTPDDYIFKCSKGQAMLIGLPYEGINEVKE